MKPSIIVLGSVNMDIVLRTSHLPVKGETVSAKDIHYIPGGKGLNQAVAAARLGSRVTLIGKIGKDSFGTNLVTFLKTEPFLVSRLDRIPLSSGLASIVVDNNGNNTIVVLAGSNAGIDSDYVQKFQPLIYRSNAVVAQLEIPVEAIYTLFLLAKQYQKITILNASPAIKLPNKLLPLIDYFIINETELAFYSDPSAHSSSPHSIIQAARKLLNTGPRTIIITLGGEGCIAVNRNTVLVENGVHVKTIDTTAAGDCFVGALISRLAHRVPISDALRFANQAAALSTTRIGASSSLPTIKEYKSTYPAL